MKLIVFYLGYYTLRYMPWYTRKNYYELMFFRSGSAVKKICRKKKLTGAFQILP